MSNWTIEIQKTERIMRGDVSLLRILGWFPILECETRRDTIRYFIENRDSKETYRILNEKGFVDNFIYNKDCIEFYIKQYSKIADQEMVKYLEEKARKEKEAEELRKAKETLENLKTYNGVVQKYPKKAYPDNLLDYDDYLIKECEKDYLKEEEIFEEDILNKVKTKVKNNNNEFYI